MTRRGRRGPKPKADPRKKFDVISEDTEEGKGVIALIRRVKKEWKEDLREARIGAAWMIGKKADRDGRLMLGKLKKLSELEQRMNELDAIVFLNQDAWRTLSAEQRLALVHHELCHLAPQEDRNGEAAYDGHGQRKWRTVKHDIEEFREVVRTHGAYKRDIAAFVEETTKKDPNLSLFDKERNARHEKPIGKDVLVAVPATATAAPADGFADSAQDAGGCGECRHTEFNHRAKKCLAKGCKCAGFVRAVPAPEASPSAEATH